VFECLEELALDVKRTISRHGLLFRSTIDQRLGPRRASCRSRAVR
jgi:hypothetical protein